MDATPTASPPVTQPQPPRKSFMREILTGQRGKLVRIASLAVTLGVWEWYGRGVDPIFMSYPTAIVAAVPDMIRSGELQSNFLSSVKSIMFGLALAITFGTTIGLLMG